VQQEEPLYVAPAHAEESSLDEVISEAIAPVVLAQEAMEDSLVVEEYAVAEHYDAMRLVQETVIETDFEPLTFAAIDAKIQRRPVRPIVNEPSYLTAAPAAPKVEVKKSRKMLQPNYVSLPLADAGYGDSPYGKASNDPKYVPSFVSRRMMFGGGLVAPGSQAPYSAFTAYTARHQHQQ